MLKNTNNFRDTVTFILDRVAASSLRSPSVSTLAARLVAQYTNPPNGNGDTRCIDRLQQMDTAGGNYHQSDLFEIYD